MIGETKVWGHTCCTHDSPLYSRHELKLIKGGYSSVHYHRERANRFCVVDGIVYVVTLYAWRTHSVRLTAGNIYDVPSLVPHMFQVEESGTMVEEYWPDRGGKVRCNDIERLTVGGMLDATGSFASLLDHLFGESPLGKGLRQCTPT